jgi:hypothetical protein
MGGMCTHKVDLSSLDDLDGSLEAVVHEAYEAAV